MQKEIIPGVSGTLLTGMSDIQKILKKYDGKAVRNDGLRLDLLQGGFRHGNVFFSKNFSLDLLSSRRQGWSQQGVLDLANQLLMHYGKKQVISLKELNHHNFSWEELASLELHIPPIIVALLPDETLILQDGNHRLGLARYFGLKHLAAFIVA